MKHTLTLDLPAIDFSDVAFLSILTDTPDFALADDLNHLYDLSLQRVDDAVVGDRSLPLYVCSDVMRHLHYALVALSPVAEGFLLLVRGSSCRDVVEAVEHDFFTRPDAPHPSELPAVRRCAILARYQDALTPVSIVTFTDDEIAEASDTDRRRSFKGRVALADLFARLLDHLDRYDF